MYFCCFSFYLSNNNFLRKLKNIESSISNNNHKKLEFFFLLSNVSKENLKIFLGVLKKYPLICKKIIILNGKNNKKFLYNFSISQCHSKYIIFLSGNCYLLKDFYKNTDYLEKNTFDIVELSHNFSMNDKIYFRKKDYVANLTFGNNFFLNEKIFDHISFFLFSKMFSVNFLKKFNLKFYYLKGSGVFYIVKTFRFAKNLFHWNKTKVCYEIHPTKYEYIEKRILIWHNIIQYINFLSFYQKVKTNLLCLFLLDMSFIYFLFLENKITYNENEKENLFLEIQKIIKNFFKEEHVYLQNHYFTDFFNVIYNNNLEKQIEILKKNNFSYFLND
ncbi:hypothetical protein JTY60_01145 [symbiont of Argiope bruennichi]|uniref:hypothetical protein n=1 Tax=symbiont of Argiope bruennichi TaxID=2810479 RepID=UPI003DA5889F